MVEDHTAVVLPSVVKTSVLMASNYKYLFAFIMRTSSLRRFDPVQYGRLSGYGCYFGFISHSPHSELKMFFSILPWIVIISVLIIILVKKMKVVLVSIEFVRYLHKLFVSKNSLIF